MEEEVKLEPFMDVSLTFRCGACCYMVVLAMYINTLLLVILNHKLPVSRGGRAMVQRTTAIPVHTKEPKEELPKKEKTEGEMETFLKYEEQRTQEQKEFDEGEAGSKMDKAEKPPKGDKTLKSARMSIRLPRAPKGHHDEELDQMEKFLAEDDGA